MNSQINSLAKSGYKGAIWIIALLGASLLFGLGSLSVILLLFLVLWLILFRNPERNALHLSENAILSPIDGIISEINSKGDMCQIRIKNTFFDVGVIRSPMKINAYSLSQIHGIPLYFSSKKEYFNSEVSFEFSNHKMTLHPQLFHISPISSTLLEFERGERIGFMKGDLVLEMKNVEIKLNVGDKVKGGETIVGYLQ